MIIYCDIILKDELNGNNYNKGKMHCLKKYLNI